MTDLEDRLERLAAHATSSNWDDVEWRSRALVRAQTRRRRTVATALALAGVLLIVVPALAMRGWLEGVLSVTKSGEQLPRPTAGHPWPGFVYGNRLFLASDKAHPIALAAQLRAPLLGQDASLAATSPNGRWVVYHTWSRNSPVLRVVDVRTTEDGVLERGAQSAAWRSDGALAYVRGVQPVYRPQHPWLGHVVVRQSLREQAVRWTETPGLYAVVGWAGRRLLVDSSISNVAHLDTPHGVLILDGPGRIREAGDGIVVAISPSGRFFFGGVPNGDSPSDRLRIVNVDTGKTVARLRLQTAGRQLGMSAKLLRGGITSTGSWIGDRIVAVTSFESFSSLVLLRFHAGSLHVEGVFRLDGRAGLHGPHGVFFSNPRFLDHTGGVVAVQVNIPQLDDQRYVSYFLTCDLSSQRCARGRPIEHGRWMSIVRGNPQSHR